MPRKKGAPSGAPSPARSQDDRTASPISPGEFASMGEALARLITEIGLARVRHRALLATLFEANVIHWDEYSANYARIAREDLPGLLGQLILTSERFEQRFGTWKKRDSKKYRVGHQPVGGKLRSSPAKKQESP